MFKKNYHGILIFLMAISALILISYYKEQDVMIQPSYQTSSMQDLHLTHRDNDEIKWELTAREAIFPSGEKEIILKTLGLKIKQSPEIYVTSPNGTYESDKGDVVLNESVVMNIADTKFTTNTLKWDSTAELLTTDDAVKFSGTDFMIEGTGLSATIKQQRIKILKNVKATFYIS
jgi:LPS export ABC transporter protein LptC